MFGVFKIKMYWEECHFSPLLNIQLFSVLTHLEPWVTFLEETLNLNMMGKSDCSHFKVQVSSVSRSDVSDSLWPHERQCARPPCPSPSPRVHPNPCPLSWWCHPTNLSSVIPFSSCAQSFPATGSFQMSQLFTSGGQSIGVSASKSVLPINTQDRSPLVWTGWISLQSKGLWRVFSNTKIQRHQFFGAQLSL